MVILALMETDPDGRYQCESGSETLQAKQCYLIRNIVLQTSIGDRTPDSLVRGTDPDPSPFS
jgi:hypothetical protein